MNDKLSNIKVVKFGGSSLSVSRLSLESGEIDVTGKVDSIIYAESAPRGRSLVSRLLGRE